MRTGSIRRSVFSVFLLFCLAALPALSGSRTAHAAELPDPKARSYFTNMGGGKGMYQFNFNQNMVELDQVGKSIAPEDMPIYFEPAFPGEGKWVSPSELVFTSYDRMPQATPVKMLVRPGLTSLEGKPYSQTFRPYTPFPFLTRDAGQRRYNMDGTVTLVYRLNMRTDIAKLRDSLRIHTKFGDDLPFEIKPDDDPHRTEGKDFIIDVKPERLETLFISLPVGFTSEEGPAPIGERDSNKNDGFVTLQMEATSMFAVRTVRGSQTNSPPWERYIRVETTNDAEVEVLKQYIDITPEMDFSIEALSGGFEIHGDFITRPRVSITFKKGTPGLLGYLTEDFTAVVEFDDFSPRLSLDTSGTILSPERVMHVPMSTINIERVRVNLWQVPESNIPLMSMGFFNSYQKHLSRKIASRTGEVNAVRNRAAENSLDLTQVAGRAKGVFLLTVADASDPKLTRSDEARDMRSYGDGGDYYYDDYYYEDDSYYYDEYDDYYYDYGPYTEKLVVISDIGIMARTMPDSITVWANSIATAKPLPGARVKVYSGNNVLLAEGRTDKDGLWAHTRDKEWEHRFRPAIVIVSTTDDKPGVAKDAETPKDAETTDIAFLKLDVDLTADDAFDTGGRAYLSQGYEAFCFTPRGVFRPGETVDFKVMVRDAMMSPPKPFPVAWKVVSSTGRTVGQGTSLLSTEGGTDWKLQLVPSAPTGRYTMLVSLPGQGSRLLGSCTFSVEDFQPPRIEVKLDSDKEYLVGDDEAAITVNSKYLFGTPVADAPWEAGLVARPLYFNPAAWRAFSFPVGYPNTSGTVVEDSGNLDDDGDGYWFFTAPGTGALAMNLTGTVRVREDGGRWVGRSITVPWYRYDTLLGYELPKQEPVAGSPYSVRVAAVTPGGDAAAVKTLTVAVDMVEYYYVRSDRGYTQTSKYTEVASGDVALKDGVGVFDFTPAKRGSYRVRIASEETDATADASLYIWRGVTGTDEGGSPLIDRVMLSWDKPDYHIGEKARLTVRSPFTGTLLLVLESDREIYRQVYTLDAAEQTIEVPVVGAMAPNAYCSAWVIRAVGEGESWGAHRAFGVLPLTVNLNKSKLAVSIDAPDEVLPKGQLPVTVTLRDFTGQPVKGEVTLAFVDEGLLSLTSFRTPDPFGFFTAKRALMSYAYDLYDALMPFTTRKPLLLQAGGDGGGDGSLLSPLSRKLELLSIFRGTLETDENGVVTTTLDLPEYSGRGRLYAVAASGGAMGSQAENVRVAREITVEATTPRMVAPGDEFLVPIFAFGSGQKAASGKVTIKTEGPLTVRGDTEYPIRLDAGSPKASIPLTVLAENASGMAALVIVTTIDGSPNPPFEQRLEVPVRPPFPRLTVTGNGLVRGGDSATIDIGGGFYPGTQKVELSFADSPSVSLFRALGYLRGYPYGCLEQTISSSWPYLAVPFLLQSLDPEMARNSEYRQALDFAIRRILSMQRGDGGFNYWPGSQRGQAYAWGSAYAAHFLTEAKSSGLVPEDAMKAALGWLRTYMATPLPKTMGEIRDALSTKAYIAYVLTINGDAPLGWMQFLKDQGSYLTDSARIFLAGAYAEATGQGDALREFGVLPLKGSGPYGWSMESRARNEALRLLMWANTDPFAGETAALAARVIKDGNDGYWYNTQENGMAVLALGRYAEKTAGASKEYTATLSSGAGKAGDPISVFKNGETPVFTREDLLPADPAAPAPLTVSLKGGGATYYSWTSAGVPMQAQPASFEGITMARRWELPDGTVYDFNDFGDSYGQETGEMPVTIPHGTQVTVTLYLKPNAAFNSLVLVDILPGGFEIENPNLTPDDEGETYGNNAGSQYPAPGVFWRKDRSPANLGARWDARTEMRDDRLLLFVDNMPGDVSSFSYTIRAVNKGTFVLPPLMAEAMYDPAIKANTQSGRVTVE